MKILATCLALISFVSVSFGAPPAPAPAPAIPTLPAALAPEPPPPLDVALAPVGAIGEGSFRKNLPVIPGSIYTRDDMSPEALAKDPIRLHLTVKSLNTSATSADVTLTAEDIFGKPVAINGETQLSVPLQKGEGQQDIPFKAPGPGYFMIHAAVHAGADTATASGDFGIVPPPHPGVRPDSLFSTTGGETAENKLELWQAVGMKKNRTNFPIHLPQDASSLPPGQAPPSLDWTDAETKFADYKAHWLWPFFQTNYTLGGNDPVSELAKNTGMYGPPADELRYAKVYALLFQHFPEIKVCEFYNEPWLFGYGFGGSAADYDRFQKTFCEEVLKLRPDMRIVAGNSSAFVTDNIEPHPSCWKGLLQGVTDHSYTKDDGDPSWRKGANARANDEERLTADRMGLRYAYVTEAGTAYLSKGSPNIKLSPYYPQVAALTQKEKANEAKILAIKPKGAAGKGVTLDDDAKAKLKELDETKTALNGEDDILHLKVENVIENADKVVQQFARNNLEGLSQGQSGAPRAGWTKYDTAYAVMTHFMEDRPAVADIWPTNELIWGGIFANPKFVTDEVKALPRAKEVSARWNVEIPKEYQDDKLKVAIIWSLTGESNKKLDTNGTLTIPNADGLKAYDMTDREIPAGKDGLTVPFGNNPVYITTETLSVMELRDRIAKGIIKNVTPVNMYAFSLMDDPTQPQNLSVRVENQLNVAVKGTLHLKMDGASEETSAPLSIEAAKLVEVTVPWPKGVAPSENNQYLITLSADVTPVLSETASAAPALPVTVSRQQIASVARFVKKTIPLTGSLDDWKGITPVLLDSNLLNLEVDLSQYVLHPELLEPEPSNPSTAPIIPDKAPRTVARVYTAYDKDNVYLAAAVNEDTFHNPAGEPAVKGAHGTHPYTLPYKKGMPGGLGDPYNSGDAFQFAFGFRDRVPGWGRQMGDPYEWKGSFYDTDYVYVAHPSTEGDMLVRLWGPNTGRENGYQTEQVPGLEAIALSTAYNREASGKTASSVQGTGGASNPQDEVKERASLMQGLVPNARIMITRNEDTKTTLYEMAIPRTELKMFDPEKGRCRFSFNIWTSVKVKGINGLNWGDMAGVFDYWANIGSFPVTYSARTPCETFFGIEK